MAYIYQAEFCSNCKKFVEIYEENYADPGSGLGYNTSGPYCIECHRCTRPVNWCINQMYKVKQVYSSDIPF